MPPIGVELDGSFDWLPPSNFGGLAFADTPEWEPVTEHPRDSTPEEQLLAAIFGPAPVRKPSRPGWGQLAHLTAQAEAEGSSIPTAMVTFLTTPDLHGRVPTCTDCYLQLSPRLIPGPEGGRLIRFLNDSQCVLLWYVLLEKDRHSVVAAVPEWKADDDGRSELDDAMTPRDFVRCAASFEEFVFRFWIENTIWFAEHRKQPLTELQQAYASAARRTLGD
jgi:hypothetical protein